MYKNHIITDSSIIIVMDDKTVPISSDDKNFNRIKDALMRGDHSKATRLADKALAIEEYSNRRFVVKNGCIYINKIKLPDSLSKRVLAFADADLDCTPLLKFWANLRKNPLKSSRESLYDFLENNGIPITEDGCFIAYKRVGSNFMDLHSHKFDNNPGNIVKMKRRDVDSDRNHECSKGLHVASFKYADEIYAGSNGKLLEVKVNPMHVVAVPFDYNKMKMRVCQYEVIRECEGEIQDVLYTATRTYYYRGTKKGDFNPNKVTSHKPDKYLYTIRARNTEEAVKNFTETYWS